LVFLRTLYFLPFAGNVGGGRSGRTSEERSGLFALRPTNQLRPFGLGCGWVWHCHRMLYVGSPIRGEAFSGNDNARAT